MKFLIKNPAQAGPSGALWGDFSFGRSLARHLRRLGAEVVSQYFGQWNDHEPADVIVTLRGKRRYIPCTDAVHLLWCISNPGALTIQECNSYDAVCAASASHARTLASRALVPVYPLLQCTDPEHFEGPDRPAPRRDVIFVGSSRSVLRPCVGWALDFGLDLKIFGPDWQAWGGRDQVVRAYVPNEELPALYASARLSLNDHYQDMKALGYVNNRVFDCLAAGLPLITDDFPELRDVCADALLYYHDQPSFNLALTEALAAYPSVRARQQELWQAIRNQFSFADRAEFLFDLACDLKGRARRATARQGPAEHVPVLQRAGLDYLLAREALYPDHRFCPVCGTTFRRFQAVRLAATDDAACPACGALGRHRAFWVFFAHAVQPLLRTGKKRALHIGPEEQIVGLLQEMEDINYRSGDPDLPAAQVRLDLARIDLADDRFHLVVCTCLQGQLCPSGPQNQAGACLAELYRITTPGGCLVVQFRDQDPPPLPHTALSPAIDPGPTTAAKANDSLAADLVRAGFSVEVWQAESALPPSLLTFLELDSRPIYVCSKPRDGRRKGKAQVRKLKARLRECGFVHRPLQELAQLAADPSLPYRQKLAARELARWHANTRTREGAEQALGFLRILTKDLDDPDMLRQAAVLEAECLERVGNTDQAMTVITAALDSLGHHADLYLAAANLQPDATTRLGWINKALRLHDLLEISLREDDGASLLDRLHPLQAPDPVRSVRGQAPRVSVIMPAFNAGPMLRTALRGLLMQTWRELEIIIVDDCSQDDTASIAQEMQDQDSRIQVFRMPRNSGTYAARNHALKCASGDLVTVHDADDWAHPQLIERHIAHLLDHPEAMGIISALARTTDDLHFYRRDNYGRYLGTSYPSFMFRRGPVCKALGFWDCVRFSADREYIRRVRARFGARAVQQFDSGPLLFQRQHDASLTRDRHFGGEGFYFGARKEYVEAQTHHHQVADSLYYAYPQYKRPFPVPRALAASSAETALDPLRLDIVLVSDFRIRNELEHFNLALIRSFLARGKTIGLAQLLTYDTDPEAGVAESFRREQQISGVNMLVYGETVACDLLLVAHPAVLQDCQQYVPRITAATAQVILPDPPGKPAAGQKHLTWTPAQALANMERYFGLRGEWVPLDQNIRQAVQAQCQKDDVTLPLSPHDWPTPDPSPPRP